VHWPSADSHGLIQELFSLKDILIKGNDVARLREDGALGDGDAIARLLEADELGLVKVASLSLNFQSAHQEMP
jgi:hypothetical protein